MACCFIFMVLVSGLPVFSGFRLARFFWFPVCSFSRASGLLAFSGFPVCPFSRVFRFACFPGSSGLPVFPGLPVCPFSRVFRLARFFWFPACPFSRVFRFARFPGLPVCPFSRASGLLVFSGFRLACFFGFSGLFSDFPVFFRAFRSFFCFVSRIFPFFVLYLQGGCSVLSVRKEVHKSSARIASR